MKGLRWKRSASHKESPSLFMAAACISGVGQNKPQGYVYFEVVCSSTPKCASRLHISYVAVFYQRFMFLKTEFSQSCMYLKDPCFSRKHVTKAPYSSRWLHVLQGCMLPRMHAPQAAYLS
jgi:hypothetical protein